MMEYFSYTRTYRGPVKAVILDLAGTTIDYGSCAPAGAFVDLFQRYNIEVSSAQARIPMGIHKKDHIRVLAAMPAIADQWQAVYDRNWTEEDIEAMYQEFIPIQIECLPRYGKLVPGTIDFSTYLRASGIKIGVTTGYNQEMMNIVLKEASGQGFVPDSAVCASQVAKGRPAPWLIYRSLEQLDVYPPQAAVKIGDTLPDLEAGLNAGVWTIGVAKTGNMLGLDEEEVNALPAEELERQLQGAYRRMLQAGAHYVVDGVADCLNVLDEIAERLKTGEQP